MSHLLGSRDVARSFFFEHDFTCFFIKKKGCRRNGLHKAPETKPQRKWPKHTQQTERKERRRGDRPPAPIRLDLLRREPTTLSVYYIYIFFNKECILYLASRRGLFFRQDGMFGGSGRRRRDGDEMKTWLSST
jgi:hypothetical protein